MVAPSGGGGGVWGSITGQISAQTDLQTALAGKSNNGHTHVPSDVIGLGTAASRNVPASGNATGTGSTAQLVTNDDTRLTDTRTPTTHTHTEAQVTGLTADLAVAKRDPVQIIIDAPVADTIPLEEYALAPKQLAKAVHRVVSGSVTWKIQAAGVDVAGLAGTSGATQATATVSSGGAVALGARTQLVITAVSTSPAPGRFILLLDGSFA